MKDFIEFTILTESIKKISISARGKAKKIMFKDTIKTEFSCSQTDYHIFFEDVNLTEYIKYIKKLIYNFFNDSIPDERIDIHSHFIKEQVFIVLDELRNKTFDYSDIKEISFSIGIKLPHSIKPDHIYRKCTSLCNGKKPIYNLKMVNKLKDSKDTDSNNNGYFLSILNMNF